jgi:uncharacterized protein YegL
MQNRHQVHNLIILDESGSMESIKSLIINGFNELVQSVKSIEGQFPEQEHLISMVSFNSLNNNIMHFLDPINKLETINDVIYSPSSMTPLFDAMGFSLLKLKKYLEGKTNYNVLVTILTDGEENSSKEFTADAIKNLVEELKEQNWTFTYIGAEHDVEKMADSLSIKNTMTFQKNSAEICEMFIKESRARAKFSLSIRNGELDNNDYYSKIVNLEVKKDSFWKKLIS